MTIFEKLKLLIQLNAAEKSVEEGIKMKNATKVIAAIVALLVGVLQNSSIQAAVGVFLVAHPALSAGIAGLTTVLALIHNPKATSASGAILLAIVLGFPGCLSAQSITGSSDAIALRYAGEWTTGSLVTQSFDFLDVGAKKSSHVYLIGEELVAGPTAGFNIFAGGLKVQPDLSALLKKTNLPVGNVSLTVSAAAGNGLPNTGGSHISFLAGGGVQYRATSALTWNALQAQYVRYGSNDGALISTGLTFLFGGH